MLSEKELEAVIALANATIGFIAYWFLSQSLVVENYLALRYPKQQQVYFILFQRYTGFLFLGLLPTLTTFVILPNSWADYGVKLPENIETLYWIVGLTAIIIPLNAWNAKKADNLLVYPQIRATEWTKSTFMNEYTSWIAYLLAYELLFRGFLLFALERAAGAWVATMVNVALYAIAHIPKGQKEAIGAIPLGLLLCYLTLRTGDIWIAVVVHICLALSNSFFSFLAQSTMKYKKN
jgi:membrane protease YdiL (CAAX protease family)